MKTTWKMISTSTLLILTIACSDGSSSSNEEPADTAPAPEQPGDDDGEPQPLFFAFDDGEEIPVFIRGSLNDWGADWGGDLALAQSSGSQLSWADDCYQGVFALAAGETIFKFASNHASWFNLNIGGFNDMPDVVELDEEFALNVDYQAGRGIATGDPAALRIDVEAGYYQFQICFENASLFEAYLTVSATEVVE